MGLTLDIARQYLDEESLRYQESEDYLFLNMRDDHGKWQAMLYDVAESFACASVFPVNAPEERRPAVAELIARLNWRTCIGNWELDFADGEVRFKTSVPVRTVPLTIELARDLCRTNFSTFHDGWRLLLKVISGACDAAEAIEEAESEEQRQREEFDTLLKRMGFPGDQETGDKPDENAD